MFKTRDGRLARVLAAYFSRAGENYGVGVVKTGATELLARMMAKECGADLFHIERKTPYPVDYRSCTDEARQELRRDARPELAADHATDGYDVILLGYPIWWGDMPMPVKSFLSLHDFAGKTIIPFCTHAGSGISGTDSALESLCPGSAVTPGIELTGKAVFRRSAEVLSYVREELMRRGNA